MISKNRFSLGRAIHNNFPFDHPTKPASLYFLQDREQPQIPVRKLFFQFFFHPGIFVSISDYLRWKIEESIIYKKNYKHYYKNLIMKI